MRKWPSLRFLAPPASSKNIFSALFLSFVVIVVSFNNVELGYIVG